MNLTAQSASRWKKSRGKSRFGGRLFPYPGGSHAIMVNLDLSKPSTCGLKSLHTDPRKWNHHHQRSQHSELFSLWMNPTHSFLAINNTKVFEPHTALTCRGVCHWFQELISVAGTLQELDKEGEEKEVNSVVFIPSPGIHFSLNADMFLIRACTTCHGTRLCKTEGRARAWWGHI